MTLDRDKLAKILGLLGSDKTGEILSAAQAAVALTRNANASWAELLKQNAVAGCQNDNLCDTGALYHGDALNRRATATVLSALLTPRR